MMIGVSITAGSTKSPGVPSVGNTATSVDTWLNGGSQCIIEIKEHFGIE